MPIYEYECTRCHIIEEVVQKISPQNTQMSVERPNKMQVLARPIVQGAVDLRSASLSRTVVVSGSEQRMTARKFITKYKKSIAIILIFVIGIVISVAYIRQATVNERDYSIQIQNP